MRMLCLTDIFEVTDKKWRWSISTYIQDADADVDVDVDVDAAVVGALELVLRLTSIVVLKKTEMVTVFAALSCLESAFVFAIEIVGEGCSYCYSICC